jgi:hypothetical protein
MAKGTHHRPSGCFIHNRNVNRSIKNQQADIQRVPMPPNPAPTPDPAEAARREQELREAEALIADLKNRRVLDSASMSDPSLEGGISGWLIKRKIVAKESQANTALLGVVVVAATLAGTIFLSWSNNSPGTSTLTPQQMEQFEHDPPVAPPSTIPAQPASSYPTP